MAEQFQRSYMETARTGFARAVGSVASKFSRTAPGQSRQPGRLQVDGGVVPAAPAPKAKTATEKRFGCPLCRRKFATKGALTGHKNREHKK